MFNTTKIALTAIALSVAAAGSVSADSYITLQQEMMTNDQVTISTVTADVDGYVAVYDYRLGEFGDLLGSAKINAGANSDVIVSFDTPVNGDVMAVIFAGDVTSPDLNVFQELIVIETENN